MFTAFQLLKIFTGFVGSLAFAITFNIRGRRLLFASLGGLICCIAYELLTFVYDNEFLRSFIVAIVITLYSELTARFIKSPTTTFTITSLLPLIPGGALYYTMSYAFQNDLDKFYSYGLLTLQVAGAIALGIIIASASFQLVVNIINHLCVKKRSKNE